MSTPASIVAALLENEPFGAKDAKDFILNRPRPKKIDIVGRRWFRRGYGGTYCTADIYVDDELVHQLPRQYGYGDYYLEAATQWLEREGYIPRRSTHSNGSQESGWRWIRDILGIPLQYYARDVKRQKDL